MAKISPTSIKYSIIADFVAEGPFQKPDVIGALFGQTEGLLGSDMELRELQKEGKIGRIEVDLTTENGKTSGEITIPTALDKTETTIIAAALETIDKIGPTDAKISIKDISDVRGGKRDYIMERAKALLAGINNTAMDSTEMETELRESSRVSKAVTYGPEGLAAGPDIDSVKELIVVEGRADVVNMLKHGIKNVIGMQGTRFPKTIATLSETKEITLFVDGDRGGKLIAQNVFDNAKVVYIATAPDGKEVEELTGKELLQCLRKKVAAEVFLKQSSRDSRPKNGRRTHTGVSRSEEPSEPIERRNITDSDISSLRELSSELKGRNILVLNDSLEIVQNVPSSRLDSVNAKDSFILMLSNATSSTIKSAEKLSVKAVAAKTFNKVAETNIDLISL
ncbi:DNA primase [archaeon]|jgi:DNA primase|nr:DNA primase [archaeon]MBT6183062.1 DNA primase [archaeon]MBT6606246.1 DNA primase [archaeon]MBT7251585.1 DNA primase [archaeon]MBT7660888.1 DNA primase [archaeon]